jgi:hypothetical protein
MVLDLGVCMVSDTNRAATGLSRVGGNSARRTVSRKETSASSRSSKPHYGMLLSRAIRKDE